LTRSENSVHLLYSSVAALHITKKKEIQLRSDNSIGTCEMLMTWLAM